MRKILNLGMLQVAIEANQTIYKNQSLRMDNITLFNMKLIDLITMVRNAELFVDTEG